MHLLLLALALPRVLIIGDSISIGYTPPLRELLAGQAEVTHNPGNAAHTWNGLEKLDAWLGERYARRELVYGLHVTDRAHMTCLVFNYSGRHLHFIDGADGGLFLAARQFKERAAKLM